VGETAAELGKSESHLDPHHRDLLVRHRKTVSTAMRGWETDTGTALGEIFAGVDQLLGKI
jgi:hypothetical protein